ncbi:hypothetical protein CEXT_471521 [Caerostris extrusa]|uniref:Secreted protein n=1 Tax=Caerostris extrusa TaxID=172846 RepID=A0AAV4XM91_CAEEX|nr:hypothetical protein CEXT_471521 [Caerostris extrusa]
MEYIVEHFHVVSVELLLVLFCFHSREKNIRKTKHSTQLEPEFRSRRRRSVIGGRSKLLSEKQATLGRLEVFYEPLRLRHA